MPKENVYHSEMKRRALAELLGEDDSERYTPASFKDLQAVFEELQKHNDFHIGQAVVWKPGCKNSKTPEYGEPAIVTRMYDKVRVDAEAPMHSNVYLDECDIAVGMIIDDNFVEYLMDSRRWKPLDALPAPDHNTCAT